MMTQPGSPKLDLRSVLYERAFGRLVDPPQPDVVFRFHVGLGTRAFFCFPAAFMVHSSRVAVQTG